MERIDGSERAVLDSTMSNTSHLEKTLEDLDYVKPIIAPKSLQDGSSFVIEPLDTVAMIRQSRSKSL